MLTALRALAGRVPWPRLPHWSKEAELAILAGSLSFGLIAGGAFAARSIGADRPASIAAASLVEPTATPAPTVTPTPELKPIEQVPIRTRSLPKLVIPQIRVDASMHPVGLTQSGAMDIPLDGERIAWYSLGPFPGTPGNAVLAGHVDWQSRAAVFSRLRDLRPGMPLYLETERGAQLQYAVSWVEQYRAQAAPLNRVFENSVGSTLTLITCGGTFDSRSRTYPDRLVVRAVRV